MSNCDECEFSRAWHVDQLRRQRKRIERLIQQLASGLGKVVVFTDDATTSGTTATIEITAVSV